MLYAALQAEVTGGGIPLSELNCATCESRKLPVCCLDYFDGLGNNGSRNDIRVKRSWNAKVCDTCSTLMTCRVSMLLGSCWTCLAGSAASTFTGPSLAAG